MSCGQYHPLSGSDIAKINDAARLADQLEHIHQFGQPFIAAEYSQDVFVHDMNIAYTELAGTNKSFALGIAEVGHIEPIIEMFDIYMGAKGAFLKRPFCTIGGCPIVSPLRFGEDNAQCMVKLAELGMVADIAVAPQAGATSPAALAGANMIAAYPGVVGSLIGQSFEGMVIDNDMLGSVQRLLRGIEVSDETLSYETVRETVYGAGHYLGNPQTLELMQTEYLYPEVADRRTPGEWEVTGKQDVYELAHGKVKEILGNHYPQYIDPAVDKKIRESFPIRLSQQDMRPGNGRW